MRKLKKILFSLLCVAGLATALCLYAPAGNMSAVNMGLYLLFVLTPVLAAIVLQLRVIQYDINRFIAYIYIYIYNEERDRPGGTEKHFRFSAVVNDAVHTIARLKSMGIDPSRAGPFMIFA